MTAEQADVLISYMQEMSERSNHQQVMASLEEDGIPEAELDAACRALSMIAGRDFSIL